MHENACLACDAYWKDGPRVAPRLGSGPDSEVPVTARGARNHARKVKRGRRATQRPVDVADLPRALRLVLEGVDLLTDYVSASGGRAAALALAESRQQAAVDQLVALLAQHDPMDVAELVHIRNLVGDPESYRETEHEGSLAVVEIVTLAAAATPGTHTQADASVVPAEVVDQAQVAALGALEAASMRVLFESAEDPTNPLSPIGFGSVLREMSLRNTSYPHMLRDTLLGLFGTDDLEPDLVAATGLTIAEILAFADAAGHLRQDRWGERLAVLQPVTHLALGRSADPGERQRDLAGLRRLHARALVGAAEAGAVDAGALSSDSGLDVVKAQAFIDLFALDCSALDAPAAAMDLLSGGSALRTRPIVRDANGRAFVTHSALLMAAIRPRLEDVLAAAPAGAGDRYIKHRGDYAEDEAVRLIAGALPSPAVHAGVEYFVPDPRAAVPQDGPGTSPAGYTKLVKADGLVILDDIAIIIESKAVDVSDGTRRGHLGGIRRNLRSLVTKTVEQAHRMRRRIEADRGLRLRDGSWLDLSHVREIHSVAVSLEDLSGLATVTSHLVDAGLVDPEALPWIVSLHDLRIITELLDRPSDLLFFLRRRTHPDVTRKFWAIDELDFYMHFLATGLFVEPDPDLVADALPHMPAATTADRRRYAQQTFEFLTSRTGPLDDFYFHQLGLRQAPAPKPAAVVPPPLARLVDAVAATGKRGWPATVLALLEGSAGMRQYLLDGAAEVVRLLNADGRTHTATGIWGHSASTLSLLVFAGVATPLPETERERLRSYMRAKKHQAQAALAATVVLDASGEVVDLLYENNVPGPDAALDAMGATLRPLERPVPIPPKARAKQKRREAEQARLKRERERRERDAR